MTAQKPFEGSQSIPSELPELPQGRIEGPAEFAAAIRLAFSTAAVQGWREIIMSDANFESWPLGERAVAQTLNDWAKTGRTLTMLARNYDEIMRGHARFVTWRRTWSHIVVCRANTSIAEDDFPSALWSPVWVCQKLDLARSTAVAGAEPARRVAIRERLDECLRRSSPSFPSTTLGL
jgi:hypothetical protein